MRSGFPSGPGSVTGCPPRRSGSTRRGRARRTCGSRVTIRHRRVNMPTCLTSAIRRNLAQDTRYRGNRMIARTHILRSRRWAPSTRTPGGCMTCWEMCGSGCRIVTITVTKVHQPTVQRGRRTSATGACTGAVPGASGRSTCVRRTGTGTSLTPDLHPWVSSRPRPRLALFSLSFYPFVL